MEHFRIIRLNIMKEEMIYGSRETVGVRAKIAAKKSIGLNKSKLYCMDMAILLPCEKDQNP